MQRQPLAERLRPSDFSEIVGQRHLFGENGSVTRMISQQYIPNMIFWGTPGTGKTTAAGIIAKRSGMSLHRLNATSASTADVKEVIAQSESLLGSNGTLLYLDEIQYFNKKQQQTLLESLEDGRVKLIASTTENPYMYVYSALISRSVVFEFRPLSSSDIAEVILRGLARLNDEEYGVSDAAVTASESGCAAGGSSADGGSKAIDNADMLNADVSEKKKEGARSSESDENVSYASDRDSDISVGKSITPEALDYISRSASGDVRRSLNILEAVYFGSADSVITRECAVNILPTYGGEYDRDGTVHYDLLSALQKSIRGSDPDAAIFYLVRILEGGDLIGACRRLQVIASEDIGAAYPMAAVIVRSCVESAKELGMPEASIPLSNAVITLATAPKSNSAYLAYDSAKADYTAGHGLVVPSHMRPSDKYDGYLYPHDYPDHYVKQQYLPEDIAEHKYYEYGTNKTEQAACAYWKKIKENR